MKSILRSLLLLGLPAFEAPMDVGHRRLKALHLANRHAFLSQQALLYSLLDEQGNARHSCQASLEMLGECLRHLQTLMAGEQEQEHLDTLARLSQAYSLILSAAGDDDLRHVAFTMGELLLLRSMNVAKRVALGCELSTGLSLVRCGQVYAYSQRALCLQALNESLAVRLDRDSLLLTGREHCQQALYALDQLVACHTEANQLMHELEGLHRLPPPEFSSLELQQISKSLCSKLEHLESLYT